MFIKEMEFDIFKIIKTFTLVCIQKLIIPKKSISDLDVELSDNMEDYDYLKVLKYYLAQLNEENLILFFI